MELEEALTPLQCEESIVCGVVHALLHAECRHRGQQMVHLDLKCANVLLPDRHWSVAKIADLGVSKLLAEGGHLLQNGLVGEHTGCLRPRLFPSPATLTRSGNRAELTCTRHGWTLRLRGSFHSESACLRGVCATFYPLKCTHVPVLLYS